MRFLLACLVVLMVSVNLFATENVFMDAYQNNVTAPLVRWRVDNSQGTEPLTGVLFSVEVHGGPYGSILMLRDDPENPWSSVLAPEEYNIDNIRYRMTVVFYPECEENRALGRANCYAPAAYCWYLPGHPNYVEPDPDRPWIDRNLFVIDGAVPAGVIWDQVNKFYIKDPLNLPRLFNSPASGLLRGYVQDVPVMYNLSDADPTPQTAPEPVSVSILAAGALTLIGYRKRA